MISPFTPIGTKIVCIDDRMKSRALPGQKYSAYAHKHGLDGLRAGVVYTVLAINVTVTTITGFEVVLEEINRPGDVRGFDIARFRPAELPKSLTALLQSVPSDLEGACQ